MRSTKINDMESFWFAEVLKYLYVFFDFSRGLEFFLCDSYLTFDDPNNISLDHCKPTCVGTP